MASVVALTDLTLADLWKEVKDPATLWGDVSRETLRAVKLLLQNRMHAELAQYLNAGHYVHGGHRRGYRNGVYVRRLTTTTSMNWSAASSSAASVPVRSAPSSLNCSARW